MTQLDICLNPSVDKRDEERLSKQCLALLARLERGAVTNVEAMREMNIFNLSARTSELRQAGYKVKATRIDAGLWAYALVLS